MGKTRQNKRKRRVEAPTGLPSVRDIELEEEELGEIQSASDSDAAIEAIIEKLQGNVEDKVFALHSLGSIFQNPSSVQDVVQQKVVRVAGPLLLDPSSPVRNATAGALRNLTASGNHEISELLVEQDVMTPLCAILKKFETEWPVSSRPADEENMDTFAQAVHLLCNLCEGCSRAVQLFNEGGLLPVLAAHLGNPSSHRSMTLAVVQCLITVTEDNPKACQQLTQWEPALSALLALGGIQPEVLLLRVLAAGVLLKLYGDRKEGGPLQGPAVIEALVAPLAESHSDALERLVRAASDLGEDCATTQSVGSLLEAQQTSLELLTNLCSGDDGDHDEYMDLSSSTSSEDGLCELGLGPRGEEAPLLQEAPLALAPEVHDAVVSRQLVPRIWHCAQPLARNVRTVLREHDWGVRLLQRTDVLRCRAFLCFSNLVPALELQELGGADALYDMWVQIANLIFKPEEPQDAAVVDAASSPLRAVLQKLAQHNRERFQHLQPSDIDFLYTRSQQSNPSTRVNMVKTAAMLGMIVAASETENARSILKAVGLYLLDAWSRESELWVQAEAVDSLIDVFGEDPTDQVAAEISLVDRLQAVLPAFKRKVHTQRKNLGEHYALVSTVNANLARFIQYKTNRLVLLQGGNAQTA